MIIAGLLLATMVMSAMGQDRPAEYNYTVWLGGHYTDFQDYSKKVGEYRLITDDPWPDFKLDFDALKGNRVVSVKGYFFDKYNSAAKAGATLGDRFKGSIGFKSMVHNKGQDLLTNMEAREWQNKGLMEDPTSPGDSIEIGGGKILTHEITDPGANYHEKRYEATSNFSLLLSHKGNVRLIAAHKSITEKGTEQKLAVSHCFSCHLTSQTAEIDRQTHQVQAGLEAEVSQIDFGYQFGFRTFESSSPDSRVYYDTAMHPVNGGARAEFGSREIYQGEVLAYGIYPETEKMSHKAKFSGDLGPGRFAGAVTFSSTENKNENFAGVTLKSKAVGGNLNYAVPLSKRTRLIAKLSGLRLSNDDPFIDLPTWRDSALWNLPNHVEQDFDYIRYSSLDRTEIDGSAEVINRMSPKTTVALLAGYEYVKREDYPVINTDYATKRMIGQIKAKYRNGLKFALEGKYRFEKTSDPFTSARGLFEARGREDLQRNYPGFPFVFYYQREDLRYQDITTLPTDRHEFEVKSTLRPDNKAMVLLGFKAVYDKNGDLDSLDVSNLSLNPHASLTFIPNPKWSIVAGYGLNYNKSRGPVTVALFDG